MKKHTKGKKEPTRWYRTHMGDLEDRLMNINQLEQQKKNLFKFKKIKDNLKDLWNNVKHTKYSHYRWVSEGEEREYVLKNVFEKIMAQIFLNLKKERDITVQETERVPNKMNSNTLTPDI